MAASREILHLLQCYLGLLSTYRRAQSGVYMSYDRSAGPKLMCIATGYIDLQKQLRNLEIGMDIIGEWTGIYYRKVIDGRIL